MAKKATTKKATESKKAEVKTADKATKKPTAKKDKVSLDKSKVYEIEGVGGRHIVKGKVYRVSGDVAEILINSGKAKIKA